MITDLIKSQFTLATPEWSKETRAFIALLEKDGFWGMWEKENPPPDDYKNWRKQVFNCIINDLLPLASEMGIEKENGDQCNLKFFMDHMLEDTKDVNFLKYFGFITSQQARQMLRECWNLGGSIPALFALKLDAETTGDELEELVKEIVNSNPKVVSDYKKGKIAAANTLIGTVIKKIKENGKSVDPNGAKDLIIKTLEHM